MSEWNIGISDDAHKLIIKLSQLANISESRTITSMFWLFDLCLMHQIKGGKIVMQDSEGNDIRAINLLSEIDKEDASADDND